MKSEHTTKPVIFNYSDKWPFTLKVLTNDGDVIVEGNPCAYSSFQKTFEDVKKAVGFPIDEKEDVIFAVGQQISNFELIADAFNVTNETGMTPRELQKSHAELLDALENLLTKTELYHDFSSHVIEARRSAWKAIDNATKNTKQ